MKLGYLRLRLLIFVLWVSWGISEGYRPGFWGDDEYLRGCG
jgi:hypothetical protein